MTQILKENQIIKVVPQDVEQACSMRIKEVSEKYLKITCEKNTNELSGNAEFFAVANDGIVYFQSNIEKTDENDYKVILPPAHKILQRREYSRIEFHAPVTLKSENNEIKVVTIDISAGGMQVLSENEISMSTDYDFSLALDKNQKVEAILAPIRQDKTADNKYLISGRFKLLKNKDRIALVQFCFRKQMENTNK